MRTTRALCETVLFFLALAGLLFAEGASVLAGTSGTGKTGTGITASATGTTASATRTAGAKEEVRIWQKDQFRIIYRTSGEDAAPPADVNGNSVPDFVEDIAEQFVVSHHILCNIAGFPDPLLSPRYPGPVYVDVYIQNRRKHGYTGVAMRLSVPAFQASSPQTRALKIVLANDYTPQKNPTATHEYFHLIQSSMTNITNGWFFEGAATWAIDAVEEIRTDRTASWNRVRYFLADPEGQKKLQTARYRGATYLWTPLAALCPKATVTLPEDDPVLQRTYTNGSPIVKDRTFAGALVVRRVLEKIADLEHIPFTRHGYTEWSRANRGNTLNDPYLFLAVEEAVAEVCRQDEDSGPPWSKSTLKTWICSKGICPQTLAAKWL